jgi:hypothetical protein
MRQAFQSWLSSDSVKPNKAPLASESAPGLFPFYRYMTLSWRFDSGLGPAKSWIETRLFLREVGAAIA